MNVYSEIVPCTKIPEITDDIKGIILSGSPFSVSQADKPAFEIEKVLNRRPLLGVCYGAQFIAQHFGGNVQPSSKREYGRAFLHLLDRQNDLFYGVDDESQVWMSHSDTVTRLPEGFHITAKTASIDVAAYASDNGTFEYPVYCIQFHPEVTHSDQGKKILENFVVKICGCKQSWTPESFVEETIASIKNTVQQDKVVLGLSGGVDSSVAAILLNKAIGSNLISIFVNNGLLRKGEFDSVLHSYKDMGLNVVGVDAAEEFITALANVSDPEKAKNYRQGIYRCI